MSAASVAHPVLGEFVLSCEGDVPLLFTENETNHERLFPGQKNESAHVKDGINDCVVHGSQDAVNPGRQGTKVAAHYKVTVGAGQTEVIRVRLSRTSPKQKGNPSGRRSTTSSPPGFVRPTSSTRRSRRHPSAKTRPT